MHRHGVSPVKIQMVYVQIVRVYRRSAERHEFENVVLQCRVKDTLADLVSIGPPVIQTVVVVKASEQPSCGVCVCSLPSEVTCAPWSPL